MNKKKGFTLIEIVLVLALIGIVTSVSYSIFFTGQKSFEVGIDKGLRQQEERIVREYLVQELRYISYLDYQPPTSKIYYKLEVIEKNDTEGYSLLKTKYKDDVIINSNIIPGNFDYLNIETSQNKINASLNMDKTNFSILLENKPNLNYINFNDNSKPIYYAYPGAYSLAEREDILEEEDIIEEDNADEWIQGNKYKKNDIVLYENAQYQALKTIRNGQKIKITNKEYWTTISEWNKDIKYKKQVVVIFKNGQKYQSKENKKGKEPPNDEYWRKIDIWKANIEYKEDDVVLYMGTREYQAISKIKEKNNTQSPDKSKDWRRIK